MPGRCSAHTSHSTRGCRRYFVNGDRSSARNDHRILRGYTEGASLMIDSSWDGRSSRSSIRAPSHFPIEKGAHGQRIALWAKTHDATGADAADQRYMAERFAREQIAQVNLDHRH